MRRVECEGSAKSATRGVQAEADQKPQCHHIKGHKGLRQEKMQFDTNNKTITTENKVTSQTTCMRKNIIYEQCYMSHTKYQTENIEMAMKTFRRAN